MAFDFTMESTSHSKNIKFEWRIRNFSQLLDVVEGPPFIPFPGHLFRWQIVLKFGTNLLYFTNFLTVYLRSLNVEGTVPKVRVVGSISLKNSEGKLWRESRCDKMVKPGDCVEFWNLEPLKYKLPGEIQKLFTFCKDDVFVVEWSATVSGILISSVTSVSDIPAVKKEEGKAGNALKTIYENKEFTDVTFKISEESVTAHKAVLSAVSAVFKKMFNHDILEKKTRSIDITDCDCRIFDCFIGYLYTKEIANEVKVDLGSILALYEVADKYEVCDLQRCCADILLCSFLNANSVVTIVEVAHMHSDQYLKEPAMQFIRHKFSKVTATPGWAHLMKNNIELASSIVSFVTTSVEERK